MICGGGNVGAQHTEEVKSHSPAGPGVTALNTHYYKYDAYDNSHKYAESMSGRVGYLFTFCISLLHICLLVYDFLISGAKVRINFDIQRLLP